jgi:ATP/maltotriose-dependent transcriptional regulator MalT
MQGRLHQAYTACQEAMQLARSKDATRNVPTLSHVYSTLSFVLNEWNDLDGALHYSRVAVNLARHWEQADALHFALDNLGYALFAAGDVEGAFDVLHQAWQVARRTSAWFEQITLSQEVEWHLAQGNLDAALDCLQRGGVNLDDLKNLPRQEFNSLLVSMAILQVFLAQKQFSAALEEGHPEYLVRRVPAISSVLWHGRH